MDILEKMNGALGYIEENLMGEVDLAEAARRACCSSFNFQRMFSFMADVSLADYIRRRRLSMAAMELLSTDSRVLDIALKYGYSSAVSFARAFQSVHGVNPSEVRRPGVKIKGYPRISFEITIKGVQAMNYRMENMGEFRLIGWKERVSMENEANFRRIPQFWQETKQSGKVEKMLPYNDDKKLFCMGVCAHADAESFDYYIATGSAAPLPAGMDEIVVPAAEYVIFECCGKIPTAMQSVWKRIFTEWFPAASYEFTDAPQLEWYSAGDMMSDSYRSEIWIPVRRKA